MNLDSRVILLKANRDGQWLILKVLKLGHSHNKFGCISNISMRVKLSFSLLVGKETN